MNIKTGKAMLKDMTPIIRNDAKFSHFEMLTVNVMAETDKEDYFGTSYRRYVTDGTDNFHEEGEIFVNIWDIEGPDMLIKVVAHEAAHLIEGIEGFDEMKEALDTFLRKEMTEKGWKNFTE